MMEDFFVSIFFFSFSFFLLRSSFLFFPVDALLTRQTVEVQN